MTLEGLEEVVGRETDDQQAGDDLAASSSTASVSDVNIEDDGTSGTFVPEEAERDAVEFEVGTRLHFMDNAGHNPTWSRATRSSFSPLMPQLEGIFNAVKEDHMSNGTVMAILMELFTSEKTTTTLPEPWIPQEGEMFIDSARRPFSWTRKHASHWIHDIPISDSAFSNTIRPLPRPNGMI
jgi:hypothetical protein